ncbi:hypothetical protein [Sphingomonas abietis]|uniref:Uncharacterized protein n=1 Tax=Sphingomonas abietis TaxID=3012344 RepID=A0ABY7NQY1_9SPHN|nr:hypothetical protein [Sphingomonas abietis]WBO23952.1 hypothetical protein PBT88_07535 [Sphingomonas abietis]
MGRFSVDRDGNITENPETPAERKAFLIYYAKVLLREATVRRGQNNGWLLRGAAEARREAAAIDTRPAQGLLL